MLCHSRTGGNPENINRSEHREQRENMEKEVLSNIWPILYLEADWPAKSYSFDFDVRLIKASEDIIAILEKPESYDHGEAIYDLAGSTQWFLSLPIPKATEHVPPNKIGISFEDQLQEAIVESFLMCLQLIRQTPALCPLKVKKVNLEGESIDPDSFENALDDYFGISMDSPPVFMPESFKIGDLQLLTDLWSAITKLQRLDDWSNLVYREDFFAVCDKEAGQGAVKEIVDAIMSSPGYSGLSKEERKQNRRHWTRLFKEALDKGDQFVHELYKDALQKVFLQKQEEVFSNRTRIGRALNLFSKGLHLPIQHSFLSMCLVLETIFTVEDAEITYQFSTRLANMTGKTFDERKDIFERARNVYKERSNIVHGRKSIESVETTTLKDAFFFARQSLQHILRNDKLLELYSDPITIDKTKVDKKAIEKIKQHFRDLDLR